MRSYVDVPNSCFSSARLPLWKPGFDSGLGHVSSETSSLGWRWPWSSPIIVLTPTWWSFLFYSECADLKVLMSWQLGNALLMPCKCYLAYILVQFMCVHVSSCDTCTEGSHVTSILHWSHAQMFRITINRLFKWLFSRVLPSQRGGPSSIPGWNMSVLGPLVYDVDDLGHILC